MNYEYLKKGLFITLALLSCFVSPALGLLLGLIFALTLENPYQSKTKKLSKILLQVSVVGLGFGMNLHSALASGKEGMVSTIFSVTLIMVLGLIIGKRLGITKNLSYLISAGTAICGGSAIAAVSPLTKSTESEISVSLATIFSLNAIALFIFPTMGRCFGLDDTQFGTWAAMAIHDTSSVVGAASEYSEKALEVATTVKLTRALWIIPLAIVTTFVFHDKKAKINIPWFILYFILAMAINSYFPIPEALSQGIVLASKKLLILTLFLIGAGLSRQSLRQVGVKPLLLALALWFIIGSLSLALVML